MKKSPRVLFKGEFLGYKVVVTSNPEVGIRCGYILLPVALKKKLGHIEDNLPVHGGVTFKDKSYWGDEGFWVGFDCGHIGDAWDVSIMRKEVQDFWKERPMFKLPGSTIKTTEFVKKELAKAAKWLQNYERMLKVKAKIALKTNGT